MKVWTFLIAGGDLLPIRISVKDTPLLDHDGGPTIWKMIGDEARASSIQRALECLGCKVKRTTEEQSPEQEAERMRLMGH